MTVRRRLSSALLASALAATCALFGPTSPAHAGARLPVASAHVPVYAYFYQWFERSSWQRAKRDFPLAGTYSSDDPHVLRRQINEARWAGINGFLTSWKSTPALDRRLRLLLRMAALTRFDVGVVYEALDFDRNPLPISKVRSDLALLVARWVPQMQSSFGKPVIIWTGTNEYTHAQIKAVHAMLAGRALLLAASKSVSDYLSIADVVDGEAYYWSSANPRSPSTAKKLDALAAVVHRHHGIWIAPAAPGFDGRPLGHTRVIDRAHGRTFVRSLQLARATSPDAIGAISWNEWSENTYIEPGRRYGREELDKLHAYLSTRDHVTRESGQIGSNQNESGWTGLRAAGILVVLTGIAGAVFVGLGRRSPSPNVGSDTSPPQRDGRHPSHRGHRSARPLRAAPVPEAVHRSSEKSGGVPR